MKDIILKYLRYLRAIVKGIPYYSHDLFRMIRYSRIYTDEQKNDSEKRLLYSLMAKSHVIEKGLSMPNRRLGFGSEALIILINELKKYINLYGVNNAQIKHIIGIIIEYKELHEKNNYNLDEQIKLMVDDICFAYPEIKASNQISLSADTLFESINKPFDQFSESRHSCRNIAGKSDLEKIRKAIQLALHAPSACNKQPVKVHLITSPTEVKNLLDLQQGNRGFGHQIEQLLLVTVDIRSYGRFEDRFNPYLDAGLFCMSLLYALHFYKIATIPLVWIDNKKRNFELHKIVNFPQEEYPCLIIGIGEPASVFLTTASKRNTINDVLTVH